MLPFLLHGGLPFQVFVGFLAMIGVAEMLRMKHLEFSQLKVFVNAGAFVLTVPLDNHHYILPIDSNFAVYGLLVSCWQEQLSIVMIIHSMMSLIRLQLAFMWGGFQVVNARMGGLDKVLFALFIVWATDIGAYMIGRRFGQRKLMPRFLQIKLSKVVLAGLLALLSFHLSLC